MSRRSGTPSVPIRCTARSLGGETHLASQVRKARVSGRNRPLLPFAGIDLTDRDQEPVGRPAELIACVVGFAHDPLPVPSSELLGQSQALAGGAAIRPDNGTFSRLDRYHGSEALPAGRRETGFRLLGFVALRAYIPYLFSFSLNSFYVMSVPPIREDPL